jgi:hypothetical protein
LPQAIDRKDSEGKLTKGVWNSLDSALGKASFDDANKGTCWVPFQESGCSFGEDFKELVGRAKGRYSNSLARIDESPDAACILTVETKCFGFGVKSYTHRCKTFFGNWTTMGF